MARLPSLIDALSQADPQRDRATLDNIARAIREDGLLPPSPRGRGANDYTLENATDLLLASQVPVPRGEASRTALQFRSLRRMNVPVHAVPLFQELVAPQTFGEAMEVLIERADKLASALVEWTHSAYPALPGNLRRMVVPKVEVTMTSRLSAVVAINLEGGPESLPRYQASYAMDVTKEPEFYQGPFAAKSDRVVSVTFGLPTILRLHEALFPVEQPE
jgi:hypothetical protein